MTAPIAKGKFTIKYTSVDGGSPKNLAVKKGQTVDDIVGKDSDTVVVLNGAVVCGTTQLREGDKLVCTPKSAKAGT